jgi:hypothetical protein
MKMNMAMGRDMEVDMDMNNDTDTGITDMNTDIDIHRFKCQTSDIGKRFNPISDIIWDSTTFSLILRGRY